MFTYNNISSSNMILCFKMAADKTTFSFNDDAKNKSESFYKKFHYILSPKKEIVNLKNPL